jgi:hypothetical protein
LRCGTGKQLSGPLPGWLAHDGDDRAATEQRSGNDVGKDVHASQFLSAGS